MARSNSNFRSIALWILGASAIVLLALSFHKIQTRQHAQQSCLNVLKQIAGAKESWALENRKAPDSLVTWSNIRPFFREDLSNACNQGGVYSIGVVSNSPSCSVHGDLDNYKSK